MLTAMLGRRLEVGTGDSNLEPPTPTARVRELAARGMRPAQIARVLGMSRKDVNGILNRTRRR
jgi:hypothetical protein